ncbi:HU family DNA-binding protein, partial [Stenotrophomonas sp. NPDC077659]|uniref:HU family DNA-binding protein n=1 Tax=Stenotrophomonas sp. NPDC077659 TaxID=3390694 RepID=UPI003D06F590
RDGCRTPMPWTDAPLAGFGNFDLRRKNQRPGRNPKTGEEIPISARTVVTFRPGQKLKERVEAYAGSGQ